MARTTIEPRTELGRQLEKERINRGLSKDEWAEELATSKPTYNQWLRGQEPMPVNIRNIAKTLGISTVDVWLWLEQDHAKDV